MEVLGHLEIGNGEEGVKIAQFTDLHQWPLGLNEFHTRGRTIVFEKEGYSNEKNIELVKHVLKTVQPELAIFTGDIIDGRGFEKLDARSFIHGFQPLIDPCIEAGTKWIFLPGNHDDDQSPWKREELLELFSLPGCATPNATSFNFTMTIGPTPEPDPTTSARLWCFDSGGNNPDPKVMYDTFDEDVVDSYRTLSASGELEPSACGLAFFHIPLPEYAGLRAKAGKLGLFKAALNGGKVPMPWCWEPFTSIVKALGKDRVVGSSKLNSGLFDAFKENGNVLATFCGHDHHNDAVMERDGIYLCYGRCGSFTPPHDWEGTGGPLPFEQGARIIHVKPSARVETFVETFTQSREDHFLLL